MKRRTQAQSVEPTIINYDTGRMDHAVGHMSDYDGYSDEARQLPARQPRQTFVPAAPARRRVDAPTATVQHTIDVPLSSTQHVEMKTSAVDRAQGYLISTVPLLAGLALLVVIFRAVALQAPVFSLVTLAWFWSVFVGAWLFSYVVTLLLSAEGVAWQESRSKWSVIKEEQRQRWNHYNRLVDGGDE